MHSRNIQHIQQKPVKVRSLFPWAVLLALVGMGMGLFPIFQEAIERKRQEEAERIEAERLAKWRANFPFKPIYHPTLRFDPSIYKVGGALYNIDDDDWGDGELERFAQSYQRAKNGERIFERPVAMHGYLKGFFENPIRFSRQFEEMHNILAEYDRAHDPYVLGNIFTILKDYHEAKRHPPNEIHGRIRQRDRRTGKMVPKIVTWGERAKSYEKYIVGSMTSKRDWLMQMGPCGEEEAREIKARLIAEIDGWDALKGGGFAYIHWHEEALQKGDPFLIPYEDWLEDWRAFQKRNYNWTPPGHP